MMARLSLPHIVFETTNECSLSCRFCYEPAKRFANSLPKENSYKQAKRTLSRLFTQADVAQVAFSGGEPFLAERFLELVLFTRMKGKAVSVISNGATGTHDDYRALIEMGVTNVQFPCHAHTPLIHDALTGVAGSWEKACASIEAVRALGGMPVAVIVATKENAHIIGETLAHIKRCGVRHVMLNRFNVGGRGVAERDALELSPSALNAFFACAEAAGRAQDLTLTSNVCMPFCVVDPEAYPGIRFTSCASVAVNMPLTLTLSGDMRICNHSPTVIGNIFTKPVSRMLSSDYVRAWRETVPSLCEGCARFARCMGGCRAASEQLGGTLSDADPIIPRTNKEENVSCL